MMVLMMASRVTCCEWRVGNRLKTRARTTTASLITIIKHQSLQFTEHGRTRRLSTARAPASRKILQVRKRNRRSHVLPYFSADAEGFLLDQTKTAPWDHQPGRGGGGGGRMCAGDKRTIEFIWFNVDWILAYCIGPLGWHWLDPIFGSYIFFSFIYL